jgi:antirestriction protein
MHLLYIIFGVSYNQVKKHETNRSQEEKKMTETRIFLNTWGAYNNGCIGYGWMTADEAETFIEEDPERDGGEWFIADIDNYLGIEFRDLNYSNVDDVIETIRELEDMDEYERNEVVALMEYLSTEDVHEAIEKHDSHIFYEDIESYHDSCDELIEQEMQNAASIVMRYFDYDAYHRDCDFDVYEASNGIVIAA